MLLIKNANVYFTHRKEFIRADVLVENDVFKWISKEPIPIKDNMEVVDAEGKYLVPGLIDCHMHIESSMTTASRFSEAVLPFGVTTIVADPHEIANVYGLKGMKAFMADQPKLDIFYAIPSSVPSTNPALETTGGEIAVADVEQLVQDKRVICFGEIMNYPDLVATGETKTKKMIAAFKQARPLAAIEGHCPKIVKEDLAKFVAAGVGSDHTHQTPATMLERIDNDMFIQIQWKSLNKENIQTLKAHNLFNRFALVTDDVLPDDLAKGHLNQYLLKAVACGLTFEEALYCTTYTPAQRMNLFDRGIIAPGKIADFTLLNDITTWDVECVYKTGTCLFNKTEKITVTEQLHTFPNEYYHSIKRADVTKEDFVLTAPQANMKTVDVRVISKEFPSTFTEEVHKRLPVEQNIVQYKEHLNLITVIERYGNNAPIKLALLENGITEKGAIASSWAHDHHNIIVLGLSETDMAIATNRVIALQGGIVVVRDGKIIAECPLPLAGIISEKPIPELAKEVKAVRTAMQTLGYQNQNEIMSFATLSLLVSPSLKLSDKGLIDTKTQTIKSLFV